MKCPICKCNTKTLESRQKGNITRRRKECVNCLTRFTTHENIQIESVDKHLRDKYLYSVGG